MSIVYQWSITDITTNLVKSASKTVLRVCISLESNSCHSVQTLHSKIFPNVCLDVDLMFDLKSATTLLKQISFPRMYKKTCTNLYRAKMAPHCNRKLMAH